MMLSQFILFGGMILAIACPIVKASCNEEEKACQSYIWKYAPCDQSVKDICAKKDTTSCMEAICTGCEEDTCQYVKPCRTKAGDCIDKCIEDGLNISDCVGWWSDVLPCNGILTYVIPLLNYDFCYAYKSYLK